MSNVSHDYAIRGFADVVRLHEWDRIGDYFTDDAVLEYPQSGERFRGLPNIRAQFENYPGLGPGTSELTELVSAAQYALTPAYTVITVEGSADRGTAVVRVRYPDGSLWWAINLYELRDGRIAHSRSYFAPDFEAPEWRAPYRESP
jgi:ketosteroid isomerase-like protein